MFTIQVQGLKEAISKLNDLEKRQLPFALAKSLTMTAKNVQEEVVKALPGKFTLRTTWWQPGNRYGFNIRAATKTSLQAEVFTRAPWMSLQEAGGTKKPLKKYLSIPTDNVRRTKKQLIAPSQKPQALKRSFFIKTTTGQLVLFARKNKKTIAPMYAMEQKAEIKPVLQFVITARKIVAERWSTNFSRALDEAMKTAR